MLFEIVISIVVAGLVYFAIGVYQAIDVLETRITELERDKI